MYRANQDGLIVILGMTDKVDRYAYLAYERLKENGFHNIVGITPKEISFEDIRIIPTLKGVTDEVDTLTLYVGSKKVEEMAADIIALHPKRIIFNPGTESEKVMQQAQAAGIEIVVGCTLVMLGSNQF